MSVRSGLAPGSSRISGARRGSVAPKTAIIKRMNQSKLRSLLNYDPLTGLFTWRVNCPPRGKLGEQAGHSNGNGYIRLSVLGKKYYAHRLAFVWMIDKFPNNVDHINGNPSDNRWENLRSVSQSVNMANTVHGNGVRFCFGKWYARYSNTTLGAFESREAARECYLREKAGRAGLVPERSLIVPSVKNKREHISRTYLGKSLNYWARQWCIPQPTLHHQIVVQGRSFDEIAALKGMTKLSGSAADRGG